MAHEDFDRPIDAMADQFDAASDTMVTVVRRYIDGTLAAPDAEAGIEAIGESLKVTAREFVAAVVPQAYADGISQAVEMRGTADAVAPEDHPTMAALSQRRLERLLTHAVDGLVVDGLDRLDQALEDRLSPLKAVEAQP